MKYLLPLLGTVVLGVGSWGVWKYFTRNDATVTLTKGTRYVLYVAVTPGKKFDLPNNVAGFKWNVNGSNPKLTDLTNGKVTFAATWIGETGQYDPSTTFPLVTPGTTNPLSPSDFHVTVEPFPGSTNAADWTH